MVNEISVLEHIRISNHGAVCRILDRNSPAVWNIKLQIVGVSVFHENLNLSNILYDYDSLYVVAEVEISNQISHFF